MNCSLSGCNNPGTTKVEAIATLIRDDFHKSWSVKPRPVEIYLCDGHLKTLLRPEKLAV